MPLNTLSKSLTQAGSHSFHRQTFQHPKTLETGHSQKNMCLVFTSISWQTLPTFILKVATATTTLPIRTTMCRLYLKLAAVDLRTTDMPICGAQTMGSAFLQNSGSRQLLHPA